MVLVFFVPSVFYSTSFGFFMLEKIVKDTAYFSSLSFSTVCGVYAGIMHLEMKPSDAVTYFLMAGYVPLLVKGISEFTISFFSERVRC